MKKEDLELNRAEIFRGRQHRLVFLELEDKALMVSEIMRKVNSKTKENQLRLTDVSRALKWLEKKDYSICLNPSKERGDRGIVYKLSKKGADVKKII